MLIKYRASDSGNDKPSCLNHSFIDDSYIIWREYKQKVLKASKSWQREKLQVNSRELRSTFEAAFALKAFADQESLSNFDGPLEWRGK